MERFVNNKNALHIALKPHAKSKYTRTLTRSHGKPKLKNVRFTLLTWNTDRKEETLTDMYIYSIHCCIYFINKHRRYVTACYTIHHNRSSHTVRDECLAWRVAVHS